MKFKKAFNDAGEMSVGKLIAMLILVVIAMALLPTIVSSVNAGENATTGTAHTLVPLVTIFYVIAVIVGVVMWVVHETKGVE